MFALLFRTLSTGAIVLSLIISARAHASFTLQLEIGGHQYTAQLSKNIELETQLRNSSLTDEQIDQHYTGYLQDFTDSWLRVSNIDGKWQGVVSVFQQIYVIDGNNVSLRGADAIGNSLATRPVNSFGDVQASCGLDDHANHRAASLFQSPSNNSALELPQSRDIQARSFNELCTNKVSDGNGNELCLIAELELAFDQEFQATTGASASSHATSIINIVDGIYRNNLNVSFETLSLTMLNNGNDVFSDTTNASNFLNDIATRKNNNSIPFITNQNALFHVVTGRNFDGSTVGVAYVNALCRSGSASGTSQLIGSGSSMIPLTAVVVAHELGHNFGSGHDSQGNSCGGGFIMFPSVNPNATDFSSCSRTAIQNAIGGIEDSSFRAPLNACFNFPIDLSIAAGNNNPSSVTLNQRFSASYAVTPTLASAAALSNASVSGTVTGGELFTATIGGQSCSVTNNNLSFNCSLDGLSNASNVAIDLAASANLMNLSLSTSISDPHIRDVVASNNSLQVQFTASGGGGGSDSVPDAFSFTDQTGVAKNLQVISDAITVSGIDTPASISIDGGDYSIDNGAFTNASGTVNNGNTVRVRHTSSSAALTAVSTTLTIGGVNDTFTSTTQADPVPPPSDSTPNAFVFVDVDDVAVSSVQTSNAVTVSGINIASAISVSNGEYSVNSQPFTGSNGTVVNGDVVRVRHTASSTPTTRTDTSLVIGGVSDVFTSITASASSPDPTTGGNTPNPGGGVSGNDDGGSSSADVLLLTLLIPLLYRRRRAD